MFNRGIQFKVVKTNKVEPEIDNTDAFERKVKIITDTAGKAFKKIAIAVCAYVALDTMREVLIEKAKK